MSSPVGADCGKHSLTAVVVGAQTLLQAKLVYDFGHRRTRVTNTIFRIIPFQMERILTMLAWLVALTACQTLYCNYNGMGDVKIVHQCTSIGRSGLCLSPPLQWKTHCIPSEGRRLHRHQTHRGLRCSQTWQHRLNKLQRNTAVPEYDNEERLPV